MPKSVSWNVLLAASILFLPCAATVAQNAATEGTTAESTKPQSEARLTAMREQAQRFRVRRVIAGKPVEETLRQEAEFRYSDQPRNFADATVWCWGARGRPAVLAKVEMARDNNNKTPFWNYCMASLSSDNVEVEFDNTLRLRTKKPGIEFHPFPDAPDPADKAAGRQRQMKQLVGRLTATIDVEERVRGSRQEMRLLPSPVHRYADDQAGIRDGTIFALTTNGTNPDTLIVIELTGSTEAPIWQYGIVRMTTGEVRIRLNDQEVWTFAAQPLGQTWQYFTQPRQE